MNNTYSVRLVGLLWKYAWNGYALRWTLIPDKVFAAKSCSLPFLVCPNKVAFVVLYTIEPDFPVPHVCWEPMRHFPFSNDLSREIGTILRAAINFPHCLLYNIRGLLKLNYPEMDSITCACALALRGVTV